MPWGDNTKGPWGSGGGPKPENKNNGNEFEEILKKSKEKLDDFIADGGNGRSIFIIGIIAIILWLGSGVYMVEPEEQGVVLRFGAFNRLSDPGLKYHLPIPVEEVIKVPVTSINRVEVGVRSSGGKNSRATKVPEESLMLTGDENIVDVDFEVQWKVRDARDFLFNVRDSAETVKSIAESAMREVVGRTPIADALTEGRASIELETKKIIQEMLDSYKAGIEVVRLQMREVQPPSAVIDSFRDVQTSRADRERLRNEAEAYRNSIVPKARGEAEKITQDAEAYKQQVIAEAQGDVSRFLAVYDKYKDAKVVTKERIYLETMEKVLKGTDKVLIDRSAGGGQGVVPYLPLNELRKNKTEKEPAQ